MIEADFKGFDQLDMALKKFPAKLVKKALGKSLKKGANEILKDAKARVPVKTGTLKKSLAVRILPRKAVGNRTVVEIWARKGKKYKNDGWYANLVEFGTQRHIAKAVNKDVLASPDSVFGKEVEIPNVPAKPFMRPALAAKASDAIKTAGNAMAIEIEKLNIDN